MDGVREVHASMENAGLVVEYHVAIMVTRVQFPAGAFSPLLNHHCMVFSALPLPAVIAGRRKIIKRAPRGMLEVGAIEGFNWAE